MVSPEPRRREPRRPTTAQHTPETAPHPWSGRLRRSKLRRPELPASVLPRPRLLARIDDGRCPLTLIVAPAGFGKTTAAAEWASQEPRAAWLTADAADASLPRFWAHLREALADVAPGFGELVDDALRIAASCARRRSRPHARRRTARCRDAGAPGHRRLPSRARQARRMRSWTGCSRSRRPGSASSSRRGTNRPSTCPGYACAGRCASYAATISSSPRRRPELLVARASLGGGKDADRVRGGPLATDAGVGGGTATWPRSRLRTPLRLRRC